MNKKGWIRIVEAFIANFFYHRNYFFKRKRDTGISKARPFVMVGSVVVSGKTSNSIEIEQKSLQEVRNQVITHYLPPYKAFSSYNKNDNSTWLLNWNYILNNTLEQNKFRINRPRNSKPLQRVTDTPMIGFGGNKHWIMVRMYNDPKTNEKKTE